MKYYILIILFIISSVHTQIYGQEQVPFNFSVNNINGNEYEFFVQISNPEKIQFLEIGFLDNEDQELANEIFLGSLNKMRNGQHYFAIEGNEFKVNTINGFSFLVTRKGLLENQVSIREVYIKCFDQNFNELGVNRQIIQ